MAEIALPERCYQECKRLLQSADEIDAHLDKCKRCMMEIGDRQERTDIGREFLKLVMHEFFNGRS